jgi:protein-S-isoprenylcysteine O-methyltransferase Ste14
MFEHAIVRFITSGTLITLYAAAEVIARRHRRTAAAAPSARWLRPLHVVSVLAFYALIGPTGGALLGGHGNLAGIGLAAVALALRLGPWVRYPELAGQTLFHIGLPIAVGVPWGLLIVSAPALATSWVLCRRAERARGDAAVARPAYRLIPGIW